MLCQDFVYLRHRAGLDQAAAAQYLGVSMRTIRRYERLGAPHMAFMALAARIGELPGWEGFCFRPGEVRTPIGDVVKRTEVEQRDYLYYLAWWRGWEAHKNGDLAKAPKRPALLIVECA
jgi:transcriptional regulator with XRE-family HTH domain